jgi:hypothetical protein
MSLRSTAVIAAALLVCAAVVPDLSAATKALNENRLIESYGKLPLSFEPNQGQAGAAVKFLSKGHGYTLLLTGNEAILALKNSSQAQNSVVHMKLTGADTSALISGTEPLPGKANYLIGNNPQNWHTNVPTYSRVQYHGVYPGVDLVYYGNQQQLEYDFVVSPGADPKTIALDFSSSPISIDGNGDLLVEAGARNLRFHKPVVYQTDAQGTKRYISSNYVIAASGSRVSFAMGAYDPSQNLIIDPVLSYSTYIGASLTDVIKDVAIDAAGNAYVVGQTFSSNFPTTPGAFDTTCGGCTVSSDDFVAKVNAAGSALVYSTYLGGGNVDSALGVAVDTAGNAYVAGFTQSSDFPTTGSAYQPTFHGSQDATLTELDSTGSSLVYSTFFGGSKKEQALRVVLDGSANAYITGFTLSTNFPATSGAFQTTYGGGTSRGDAYVAKLNPAASGAASLVWSTYLGGSSEDSGAALALDATGNVVVTGGTNSLNFPITSGVVQTTIAGAGDAFVSKLNSNGTALVYSTYLGGTVGDEGFGVALDSSNNAYVTGGTDSTNFPATTGALQTTYGGNNAPINCNFSFFTHCGDGFVAKLNSTATALNYATYLGGNGSDFTNAIRVDASGDAYVTGGTNSTNFPTVNALQTSFLGVTDVIVSELNATGSSLLFSTYLGGRSGDGGSALTLDSAGNIFVIGYTESPDFPLQNPIQGTYGGGKDDGFIAKISPQNSGVTLSKSSLIFNVQTVGTTSGPKAVVLTNTSQNTLTISGITISGANLNDFHQTNTCGTSVPAGGNCQITVTFSPTAAGARAASVVITDSDPSSPQKVTLKGNGTYVKFSKPDLIFGNQPVGTTSSPKLVSLTNSNPSAALTINSITITGANSGDYAQTNNCPIAPATLASGASCVITVTFTPTQTGNRVANVTVNSNDAGGPSGVVLKGTGI